MFNSVTYTAEERAYYNSKYSTTPSYNGDKTAYKIKKGDNFWNLAKKVVDKENATNAEISDMMYSIAKLNGCKTIESINSIDVGDVIYLPSKTAKEKLDVKETAARINSIITPQGQKLNYSKAYLYKLQHVNDIPESLYAAHGEAGIDYWNTVLNDKQSNLTVEKSYTYAAKPTGLHIVKRDNNKKYGPTEAHLLVQVDKNGQVSSVSYNSPGAKIHDTSFDFELDADGNLKKPVMMGARYKTLKELPEDEYQSLIKTLQQYIDKELK